MEATFTATYIRDGDWIVAWLEEIPGAVTQGKTIEEARENLHDALEMVLEARRELAQRALVGHTVISREAFPVSV